LIKILVTGAKGFIGSHLVSKLNRLNYQVIPFDIDVGDVTNENSLNRYFDKDITHVFHLAGKTFIPDSWSNPHSFFKINVMGTLNVLEFCRKKEATFILLSSYLYGEPEYLPIDENHCLKAFNPYGQSKFLAEQLARFYTDSFDMRSFIFRVFNVYGPGQSAAFLIPEIIAKIRAVEKSCIDLKDLRPCRDYIYIDDLIDALILAIEGNPGIYNVGSGISYSVKEIAECLLDLENSSKKLQDLKITRPNEVFDLYADIRLISKELGWKPKTKLKEGLRNCLLDH